MAKYKVSLSVDYNFIPGTDIYDHYVEWMDGNPENEASVREFLIDCFIAPNFRDYTDPEATITIKKEKEVRE